MAETVVAPPRARSNKGCCGGCAVALVLGLIVAGVIGLFVVQGVATTVAEEALNQYAKAQSWDVTIDVMTAPKLLVGQPVDMTIEGYQVLIDERQNQVVERVVCDLDELVYDRGTERVTSLANGTFEMAFTSAQIDNMVQQAAGDQGGLMSTTFQGTNLMINGQMELPQNLGTLKLSALCAPEIVPPTGFRLAVQDLQLEAPGGLKLPGLDLGKASDLLKAEMSKEMTTQLVDPDSGIVFETANIEGDELVIKGHLTAEALAGG